MDRPEPLTLSIRRGDTPLGYLLIATSEQHLHYAEFGENDQTLLQRAEQLMPAAELIEQESPFNEKAWNAFYAYPKQPRLLTELPVHLHGTLFQQRVWQALTQIGCGERRSYSEIAAALHQPKATRAVASACARNSIALRVPCHRVVRADGSLGGYRWGLELKQRLLDFEQLNTRKQT